ncbi:MAG: hypothetical protein ABIJ31_04510 [Pseudomonadota bacterium]
MGIKSSHLSIQKLPPATLGLIGICLVLVGLIIAVGILPKYINIRKITQKNSEQSLLLEEQQALYPLYAKADQLANIEFFPKLPFPERKALERDKISNLSKPFEQLAIQNRLNLSKNSLDVETLHALSDQVSIELLLSGQLFDFRNYLVALGGLPYFNFVQSIEIQSNFNKIKQFKVKIMINIEKK